MIDTTRDAFENRMRGYGYQNFDFDGSLYFLPDLNKYYAGWMLHSDHIAATEAAKEQGKRQPLTEFQRMQIIGNEFPLPLVQPIVIQKIDAVCKAIEEAHGITATPQGNPND